MSFNQVSELRDEHVCFGFDPVVGAIVEQLTLAQRAVCSTFWERKRIIKALVIGGVVEKAGLPDDYRGTSPTPRRRNEQ